VTARIIILTTCLLSGAILMAGARGPGVIPPRESFSALPMTIGPWVGRDESLLSEAISDMLNVDDYANRLYQAPNGAVVGFYAGYHLKGGFHSPMNCLPGSGWIPVEKTCVGIPMETLSTYPGRSVTINVNRIVVLKGRDKQVVFYWYQGCGRVIASEYWGLLYGMLDKLRFGRTDAALVRIISPAATLEPAAEEQASRQGIDFAGHVFPLLSRYIPN